MGFGSCISHLGLEATSSSARGTLFLCLKATSFSPTGFDAVGGRLVPFLFVSLGAMLCEGTASSISFAQSLVKLP